jgi:hypothetical protein
MFRATWKQLSSRTWLAMALVFLIPSMAPAQLFPNLPIRRERPGCATEPPFNAQVRRDYFGYYPTCWTRFPAGWACPCPNPELPNLAKSISDYGPLDPRRKQDGPAEGEPKPGMDEENPDPSADPKPEAAPGDNPNLPLPNPTRSPFDLDPSPTPGPGPGARPNPGATSPNTGRPSGSTSLMEMPKLPETAPATSFESPLKPGSMTMTPDATLASSESSDLRPDLGPLPSTPYSVPSGVTTTTVPNRVPAPAPAQAPRRRSFLGGLFGGNTRTR